TEPVDPTGPLDEVGTGAWATLADAPEALTEVGAASFDGDLWVVGGLTADGDVSRGVQVFDPRADAWRPGPELPAPVHHASLVATDRTLYVIGGFRTPAFDPVDDVFVLDRDGTGWREAPDLPAPRGAGAG